MATTSVLILIWSKITVTEDDENILPLIGKMAKSNNYIYGRVLTYPVFDIISYIIFFPQSEVDAILALY